MSTAPNQDQCPPPEDISGWIDEQENPESLETITSHLQECPRCDGIAGAYRRIDEGLRSAHHGQSSDQLSDRIKSRCRSLPPVQTASSVFPTLIWKAAALLALVMAAAALYLARSSDPARLADAEEGVSESAAAAAAAEEVAVPAEGSGYAGVPGIEMPDSLDLRHRMPAAIEASALTPVGSQTPAFRIGSGREVQPVPRSVRHVWLVPERGWEKVQEYLRDHHPGGEWVSSTEQDAFKLSLADTALQALVDQMDARGAALVSGTPPQPREAAKTAFTGRDVAYRMVFISQQ